MSNSMRPSTLQTLDLGSVLEILQKGVLPVTTPDLVDTGEADEGMCFLFEVFQFVQQDLEFVFGAQFLAQNPLPDTLKCQGGQMFGEVL